MRYSIFPISVAGLLAAVMLVAPAAHASGDKVPGLESAEILPGWVTPEGTRMIAIDLRLEPGWKTYWRSPGDAGMAPVFDWNGSDNLDTAIPVWPAPEVIVSGGMRSMGFHDRLVLPVEITPAQADQPVSARLSMDFGMCRDLCVPAHLDLEVPPAEDGPDPVIEAALARAPADAEGAAECHVTPAEDGLQLSVRVAEAGTPAQPDAAIEIIDPEGQAPAWVSDARLESAGGNLTASADVVPDAEGYVFDPAMLRLTLIGKTGAVEFRGCTPA